MNDEQFSDFPEDILWVDSDLDSIRSDVRAPFGEATEGDTEADSTPDLLDLSFGRPASRNETALVDLPDETMFATEIGSHLPSLPVPGAEVASSLPANLFADIEDDREQYIIFTLDEANYAIPLRQTLETSRLPRISPLPFVPEWLLGVANVRGDIISLVDLRLYLGMTSRAPTRTARMIVVRSTSDDLVTGLLVDGVRSIRRLDLSAVAAPPEEMNAAPYYCGVVEHEGDALVLLDVEQLLSAPEMRQFDFVLR